MPTEKDTITLIVPIKKPHQFKLPNQCKKAELICHETDEILPATRIPSIEDVLAIFARTDRSVVLILTDDYENKLRIHKEITPNGTFIRWE